MQIEDFTVIVSGLPRSGTSVMMQMLAAGGMPVLTDGKRTSDVDNPRGYFELDAVKLLARDRSFLDGAHSKAVKVVHAMLTHLPVDRTYRVIFMQRNLDEVLASQRKMLDRAGRAGATLSEDQLKSVYTKQVDHVLRYLGERADCFTVLTIDYGGLVSDPRTGAKKVNTFLGGQLNEEAMTTAVDTSLHRNRR